jgi:hypothetical protein
LKFKGVRGKKENLFKAEVASLDGPGWPNQVILSTERRWAADPFYRGSNPLPGSLLKAFKS